MDYSVYIYVGDRLCPSDLLNLHFHPYLQLTFSEMFYIQICTWACTHTHTLYFFTWWGPSYKYGIRPNYCDIIWRLDFFWCQYRCLYNVIFTRIAATSSCGFQFINVSILKRKDCIRQCTRNLNNGCWLFSPLLSPKFMTNCKFSALCPETSLLTW